MRRQSRTLSRAEEVAVVSSRTHDPYEGERRLFLVFAPEREDDRFDGQLLCINDFKDDFRERDLVLYEVLERGESTVAAEPLGAPDADSLRMRFGIGTGEFASVLVGKDGGEKARWSAPVPPAELFRLIDEMPMRRREVAERDTGEQRG
jgi:hypothetical protein